MFYCFSFPYSSLYLVSVAASEQLGKVQGSGFRRQEAGTPWWG